MNLSPFMRFDGYFLLSDFTGMQNLHERSFAFGKWSVRKFFLGINIPPPELLKPSTRNWLVFFAFATWLYRFFLFLSISLLVYFVFFKALGIFLMVVEVGWFICFPIIREIKQWWILRKLFRFNRYNICFFTVFSFLFILLFFPWQGTVSGPAVWRALEHREIYAPFPACVVEIAVTPGQYVNKGNLLIRLEDPDLENRIQQARLQKKLLQWQMDHQSFDMRLLDQGKVLEQQLAEAVSRLEIGIDEAEKLTVFSPISGVIAEMNEGIGHGTWVADQEPLFFLITDKQSIIEAFIREEDLNRIKTDAGSRFYPETSTRETIECKVVEIDRVNIQELEEPYLASLYGGDVAVRDTIDGRLVPEYTLYRVRQYNCMTKNQPEQIVRGDAVFEGIPESIFLRFFRRITAILIRESSF